ncbi:hypothetical protein RF11_03611 [Thelohanellus kitauei]|uniref:Uncharacterized protein n=1 Tax=Thelohanellus kitauei TaxID=669202 RepID=A0A0C2N0M4_THEKT|nr:hypothetical protein RF11_03611 [Thelohanellus kitauei]
MEFYRNDNNESNKNALEYYAWDTLVMDMDIQIQAVKRFISHFSHQDTPKFDSLFLEYFPKALYEEFRKMSDGRRLDERHSLMQILFFDVFTFIFRNTNLVTNSTAISFIECLLKLIKNGDPILVYDPDALIGSIMVCASHEPNKIMFINQNGMYNFYNYFIDSMTSSENKFWEMCKNVYGIGRINSSSIDRNTLSINFRKLHKKFHSSNDKACARFLVIIFKMIYRLGFFNDMKFSYKNLYDITAALFLIHQSKIEDTFLINHLSMLWTSILNGSTKPFQIDTFDKLIHLGAIFAIDLSRKLHKFSRRSTNFVLTEKEIQQIYIIYFTLVAFPLIDHGKYQWLRDVFIGLNNEFLVYITNHSIDHLPFEHRLLIVQYYMKSLTTLNLHHESLNQNLLTFYDKLVFDTSQSKYYIINRNTMPFPRQLLPFELIRISIIKRVIFRQYL